MASKEKFVAYSPMQTQKATINAPIASAQPLKFYPNYFEYLREVVGQPFGIRTSASRVAAGTTAALLLTVTRIEYAFIETIDLTLQLNAALAAAGYAEIRIRDGAGTGTPIVIARIDITDVIAITSGVSISKSFSMPFKVDSGLFLEMVISGAVLGSCCVTGFTVQKDKIVSLV